MKFPARPANVGTHDCSQEVCSRLSCIDDGTAQIPRLAERVLHHVLLHLLAREWVWAASRREPEVDGGGPQDALELATIIDVLQRTSCKALACIFQTSFKGHITYIHDDSGSV